MCALRTHAESRHHFVENEQRAVPRAQRAQRIEELALGRHQVHIAGDGFNDHTRDSRAVALERCFKRPDIVVFEHQRMRRGLVRHAGRTRIAKGQRTGPGFHQQCVSVAMVATFKLDDFRSAGIAAGEPDRAHRRLRARADQSHLLEAGHAPAQHFRELDFGGGRCAEAQSLRRRLLHRLHHGGMRVAENQRAPRANVIDVGGAVGVPHARAAAAREKTRRAADGTKRTHRRIDSAGDHALRGCK